MESVITVLDAADLQHYAELWADHGKLVFIAALDSTYQRRPFENVMSLVPLAESVCKLSAVCIGCHQPAAFTFRKDSSSTALEVGDMTESCACSALAGLQRIEVPACGAAMQNWAEPALISEVLALLVRTQHVHIQIATAWMMVARLLTTCPCAQLV